jgi:hypothetical protein
MVNSLAKMKEREEEKMRVAEGISIASKKPFFPILLFRRQSYKQNLV